MISAGEGAGRHEVRRRWIALGLVLVLVELAYVFILSAGTFTHWPSYDYYFDFLAEGFRSGHLDLVLKPYPSLLATANPYDRVNANLWLWDACLYDGKYYFYFGPLPALLQAAVKSILGTSMPVGDQYLYFAFTSIYLVCGTLILERLARRLFPSLPRTLFFIAVLVFAFANPIPHGLASAFIYQTAIMGGQAFLLLGVLLAFDAVWSAAAGGRSSAKLWMAGVAWGLALACRISLAPAVAVLILITVAATEHGAPSRIRRALADTSRMGAPVAVAVFGLLLYNKLRFDSWTEFGITYQLATLKFHTSAAYIPLNLYSYALRPFEWTCKFPFALQIADLEAPGVQKEVWIKAGHSAPEPLVGFLLAVPWSWLVPIGAVVCTQLGIRRFVPSDESAPASTGLARQMRTDRKLCTSVWCCATFLTLASVTGIVLVPMFMSTMRYLADFTGGIVFLGVMCAWCLYTASKARWMQRCVIATSAALGVATVILGLLFGVQGYRNHFQVHNPALYDEAVKALDFCGDR